jgi:hypothetical protein
MIEREQGSFQVERLFADFFYAGLGGQRQLRNAQA